MQLWLDIDRPKAFLSTADLGPRLAKKSVGRSKEEEGGSFLRRVIILTRAAKSCEAARPSEGGEEKMRM